MRLSPPLTLHMPLSHTHTRDGSECMRSMGRRGRLSSRWKCSNAMSRSLTCSSARKTLTHSSACKLLGVDATSSCSPWLSHAHTRTRPGQGVLDEYLQGLIRETDFLSDARYVACLSSLSLRAWSMVLVCLLCVVNASMAYVMHAWLLGVCAHGRQPGRSRCQKPPLVPAPVGRRRVPQFQRAPLL